MTPFEPIARDDELEEIAAFLDDGQALASALLLDGEPGIGKTTLWRRGIVEAKKRGYRILSCSPSEAEAELAYAALSDLVEEALPEVEDTLSPPQLRALRVAVLLDDADDTEPDKRAVGSALLGALRALASQSRVLVAIDDVQWLDASSAAAVTFAARRVDDQSIAFLLSSRGAENAFALPEERLCRVNIGPLTLGALRRLLEARLGRVYPRYLLSAVA